VVTVFIGLDTETADSTTGSPDDWTALVAHLTQVIAREPLTTDNTTVDVCDMAELSDRIAASEGEQLICPLSLSVGALSFAGQAIYAACANVEALRNTVTDQWSIPGRSGELLLPVVWTARGPLYAEAIALKTAAIRLADNSPSPKSDPSFVQPVHLNDRQRQPVYRLAGNLLRFLDAPPSVYLMQFGLIGDKVVFDRLWPFPTPAAIASIDVQTPDLLTCYWRCVTHQPISDVAITSPTPYWIVMSD
jgi:hypothetical protein